MASKVLESTVLSIEVQSAVDKDGSPTFTKKKIGNLVPDADINKVEAVAILVADILDKNTRAFYLTELSEIEA
ncbi:DUF1659 domain-containing protein [Clostridioides difficile]